MPRPTKNPDPMPPRQFRLSAEEFELMGLLAEQEGHANRSPYLRWLLRREARKLNISVKPEATKSDR